MRLVRLERQQSRVADDIRAALASLGRGGTVIGGIALVGVGGVTERPIEAVVLLPHGVIIVIGVDLPDPALRLEAPLGGPWKADGWPLVADDDSINPATEALDVSQACERQIAAFVPGTAPVGTIIAVGPYVETVDQPATDLAGPVRVLHPTPTTMLAATVSLATAHRPRSVDQVRALIRGLAPSAPEFSDEVLLAEGFSRLTDDAPPESLWDVAPAGGTAVPGPAAAVSPATSAGATSAAAASAAAASAAAASAAAASAAAVSATPGATDWRTETPVEARPKPAAAPEPAAEPELPDAAAAAEAERTEVLPAPAQDEPHPAPAAQPAFPGTAAAEAEPTEARPPATQEAPNRPADPPAGPTFSSTETAPAEAERTEALPPPAQDEPHPAPAAQPVFPGTAAADTEPTEARPPTTQEAPNRPADPPAGPVFSGTEATPALEEAEAERTETLLAPARQAPNPADPPAGPVFPGTETTPTPAEAEAEPTEMLPAPAQQTSNPVDPPAGPAFPGTETALEEAEPTETLPPRTQQTPNPAESPAFPGTESAKPRFPGSSDPEPAESAAAETERTENLPSPSGEQAKATSPRHTAPQPAETEATTPPHPTQAEPATTPPPTEAPPAKAGLATPNRAKAGQTGAHPTEAAPAKAGQTGAHPTEAGPATPPAQAGPATPDPAEAGKTSARPAEPEPPQGVPRAPLPSASPQPFPRPRPKPEPVAATPRTVRWLPLGAIGALVLLAVAAVAVATTGDGTAAAPAPPPVTSAPPPVTTPVRSLQFALRAAGGDQRCASHTFGDAQASLQQTSCSGVTRASYAATVDGRDGAVTVGIVAFPDAAQAAAFKAITDTPGAGGVLDLATETGQWGATPTPRFENAAYASKLDGSSVRIVQAVWAPGPSTPDDPGLVRAAKAALDLPAR